jgi:type II secretory ATPase GspE/PulE/Tfp pilus assembly ATPase PilB-like protein
MTAPTRVPRPPFAFAKRHGVTILEWRDDAAVIAHRPDVRVEALAEMRRHCDAPIALQEMDATAFERLLRDLYEQGGDDARQMVADMDGRVDLGSLAEELPEPEDLMESDDDAIVIRLINALLTQAVKENASDIHIEPFENRLVVRFRVDGVLREVLAPARGRGAGDGVAHQGHGASSTSPKSACRRTGASRCASPGVRSTYAFRRCHPGTANASCCACSTSRPGGSISNNSA